MCAVQSNVGGIQVAFLMSTFARSALPSFVEKGDRRRGDGG